MSQCTKDLQKQGRVYPRTCLECGLGPCKRYPQVPPELSEEDGAFTPTGAAKMLVTVYGHPNWKPTGLEQMALLVARTFLEQQTIPHYGHGQQETARNNG